MTPEQIVADFTKQREACVEKLKELDQEMVKQKELYLKLQGAIEGITLYTSNTEESELETTETEVVSEEG